jgi:hypothetical protein
VRLIQELNEHLLRVLVWDIANHKRRALIAPRLNGLVIGIVIAIVAIRRVKRRG